MASEFGGKAGERGIGGGQQRVLPNRAGLAQWGQVPLKGSHGAEHSTWSILLDA